ncbi:MAG TPA: TonB C-terminal domain-containing protein [Polyangiales bacterium]|nr:TonB C-terminal domain-containing protein [Polyangiales bacterium]
MRPPSLLKRRNIDAKMAIGGFLGVLGAHLLLPGAIAGIIAFLAATGIGRTKPHEIKEDRVVEARFVKLGKPLDPKKIPNRKVPVKTTAPPQGVAVSKNADPPKVKKPDAGPPPPRAEEDLLARLGDRAQAFAEIAEKRDEEGDPQGIQGGTETTAKAGDLYRGQLVMFFKRGWTIPTTLGDTSKLTTRARVEVTPDRHVGAHEIVKPSGDALFDQSVEDRFNELRSLGTTLPEPPPEVRSQFEGTWQLDVNFIGKKAD